MNQEDDTPPWSYEDKNGGGDAARRLFAYLADHLTDTTALESAVMSGVAEMLQNKDVGLAQMTRKLGRVAEGTHAVKNPPLHMEGIVVSGDLYVHDHEIRGALWRLEDAIDELSLLRDDLLSIGELTGDRFDRVITLVDGISPFNMHRT